MILNKRRKTTIALMLICIPFVIYVFSCYPGEQPAWCNKFQELMRISGGVNSPRWRQLAGEILQESYNYDGKLPPPWKPLWAEKVLTGIFWWVPFADPSEILPYKQALREIANSYLLKDQYREAERFLRRAVEVEETEQVLHPEYRISVDRSELIEVLARNGKLSEAAAFQSKCVDDAQKRAEMFDDNETLKTSLWTEKAKYFQLKGDIEAEEQCWRKIVGLYESETSKENLSRVLNENKNNDLTVRSDLKVFPWLDKLADFYGRHKLYVKQENVLLKKLGLQEATFPVRDPRLCQNYEDMAEFYSQKANYKRAAECLLKSLRCQESNETYEKLALAYEKQKNFQNALAAMLKSVKITESMDCSPSDGSSARAYLSYAKLLERAGKTEEAKRWRARAAKNNRSGELVR